MNPCIRFWVHGVGRWLLALAMAWIVSPCFGQAAPAAAAPSKSPAAAPAGTRKLAPDVLISIDPMRELQETVSRHDVVELLAVEPKQEDQQFTWARNVAFRRDIWYLEFKFKPMRMIWVDIPQPNGNMQRKLIRYIVYSVTNPGKVLRPVKDQDGTYKVESVDEPIFFVPEFILESHEYNKAYPDRVIPAAVGPIRLREDPRQTFYTTVEMAREIKVGETLWGVATWEEVDPRIDRFSVYVIGLTNAYKWRDEPGAYKAGDPIGMGRRLARKTLKLNFWRPGDEYYQHEDEIRYGIPGELDYEWVYR